MRSILLELPEKRLPFLIEAIETMNNLYKKKVLIVEDKGFNGEIKRVKVSYKEAEYIFYLGVTFNALNTEGLREAVRDQINL